MSALRKPRFWQWLTILAFVLAASITTYNAMRTYQRAAYWREHRDEPLRAWMNVGYVAHSYRVPPPMLFQALGLPGHPPDRRSIRVIAHSQKRTPQAVMATLKLAIETFRAAQARPAESEPGP